MYCIKCGTEIQEGMKFYAFCGSKVMNIIESTNDTNDSYIEGEKIEVAQFELFGRKFDVVTVLDDYLCIFRDVAWIINRLCDDYYLTLCNKVNSIDEFMEIGVPGIVDVINMVLKEGLYLDAGDTIVVRDISSYYNGDFEGKSLICTCSRYKVVNKQLQALTRDDLHDYKEGLPGILRGIFNSGSYMMNLEQLRKDGITMNDYLYLVQALRELIGKDKNNIYWGDQGLLGAAFAGDIKFYDYEKIRNVWYMPYNFCLWYYDGNNVKPNYIPAVVHYAGAIKPWRADYPIFLERFQNENELSPISELKIGQAEWYYLWHEYAILVDRILQEIGY